MGGSSSDLPPKQKQFNLASVRVVAFLALAICGLVDINFRLKNSLHDPFWVGALAMSLVNVVVAYMLHSADESNAEMYKKTLDKCGNAKYIAMAFFITCKIVSHSDHGVHMGRTFFGTKSS